MSPGDTAEVEQLIEPCRSAESRIAADLVELDDLDPRQAAVLVEVTDTPPEQPDLLAPGGIGRYEGSHRHRRASCRVRVAAGCAETPAEIANRTILGMVLAEAAIDRLAEELRSCSPTPTSPVAGRALKS